jgi:hypothetical protein
MRNGHQVHLWMTDSDYRYLQTLADERGEPVTAVVRFADSRSSPSVRATPDLADRASAPPKSST